MTTTVTDQLLRDLRGLPRRGHHLPRHGARHRARHRVPLVAGTGGLSTFTR
jgi:hypothetical protein